VEVCVRLAPEGSRFFIGLDLGQRRDPSAQAVVERYGIPIGERDPVTYELRYARQYRVRRLDRTALGTAYPDVVERVRRLTRSEALAGRCTVAMDATGLGAPVLDLLKRAGLGCTVDAVVITGGEREHCVNGVWHVPKADLVAGLRVMLEKKELRMEKRLAGSEALVKELAGFGTRTGEHDDLAIALALACWRARRRVEGIWGTRSLGLV
jgi:hypothetical protein